VTTFYWYAYQNATNDYFNVYRSICGITITFPNTIVAGDILKFSATSPDVQYITMPSGNIDAILAEINTVGRGIEATKSSDNSKLFIRCTVDQGAKFKLSGTAEFLSNTTQTARVIIPKLEWVLVGSVPRVANVFAYNFPDPDGSYLDYYRITSVTGTTESVPSIASQPIMDPSTMCVLEGRIVDNKSLPVENAKITAAIKIPSLEHTADEYISTDAQTVTTDKYGRFSIALLRCQQYLLQIPAVGYNEVVTAPDLPTARLIDLVPTTEMRYSPNGDPQ
jgi:hypothetical protein